MISNQRPPLASEFDIVVIGGGINGVAIARECALGGRRVLLLEKNDFASGTTSRSTRIIHGGLRYLEHGEIGLVREALRERDRLLHERPHLVCPMKFVFALGDQSRHSSMQLRAGLWMYRQLAKRTPTQERAHDRESLKALERHLDSGQRWALFQYDDAQCEYPERLVAEWLSEALTAGATARNYTEVIDIKTHDGRVQGVRIRDRFSRTEQFIRADWVVNAAGPWADQIYGLTSLSSVRPMVGGVRGSHIVVPPFPGSPNSALYTEASDGRPIFMIPWAGQLLVGTTEIPDRSNPDRVQPTPEEINYLITALNKLYPQAGISAQDISFAFAGIRPLPHHDSRKPRAITRRHIIRNHAEEGAMGMLSIIGGKLTTAAELARQCARKIGVRAVEPANVFVAAGSASGIESTFREWSRMVSMAANISESSARVIAQWHGRRALAITQLARSSEALRMPICEHSSHIVAEAVEAVRYECAVTLGDILLRRVPVALSNCFSGDCAQVAAQRIGDALGWSSAQQSIMLDDFIAERDRFLIKPTANLLASRPVRPFEEHAA